MASSSTNSSNSHFFQQPNNGPLLGHFFDESKMNSGSYACLHYSYPEHVTLCYMTKEIYETFWGDVDRKRIESSNRLDGTSKCEYFKLEDGQLTEQVFNTFFEWTKGEVDELLIHFGLCPNENVEDCIKTLKKVIAGRPIKCKMFRQQLPYLLNLNSEIPLFFRNYVQFTMFGNAYAVPPQEGPLIVCEKMVKCEFLYLDAPLANSKFLLDEFKGWGLVLRQPDPIFTFKFLYEVFQKWYEFEDIQWKYLCLPCDISYYDCKDLIDIGKIVEIERGEEGNKKQLTELQVSRDIGDFCRFGRLPLEKYHGWESKKSLVYFYIGECCDEIFTFNLEENILKYTT